MKCYHPAFRFSHELPAEWQRLLEKVTTLAMDLRWTWSHTGDAFWKSIDQETWLQTKNPVLVIRNLSHLKVEQIAQDSEFISQVEQLTAEHEEYCHRAGWYGHHYAQSRLQGVAYFSMEFGLGEALPLYAGGLGVLAGDYLKAASDMAVPVFGIGLLYQQGYFRQMLDHQGWQQEIYPYNDPTSLPVTPVASKDGGWLQVVCEFPGRDVRFRVWRAKVGRISLYLLDSNDPLNSPVDQGITSQLYGGGQELRLAQEMALGICGWRLVEALDLPINVCHLNEGHAAFATLERARSFMHKHGTNFHNALYATRPGNVFTTHTPVASGFDTFERSLFHKYGQLYFNQLGIDNAALLALGCKNPDDHDEAFNMAYLAMRTCAHTNAVSRLHGEVSRKIFQNLYPRWPRAEVPVGYVTNGIHVPSWDSPWADKLWTAAAGKERWLGEVQPLVTAIENLSDEALWSFCGQERSDLVKYARRRLAQQLGQNGADQESIEHAANRLDPNALTIGFARRFAGYKRPNLLLKNRQRLLRLLTDPTRPVQIIVAGKAHPRNETGKRFIRDWFEFSQTAEARANVIFLQDYDITLAQELVQGVDVWINTPARPWEACGTSGMKVLVNGGLNLSVLDGWWAEAYNAQVGWALGDGQENTDYARDIVDAEQLYQLLEQEIVPMFYDRDARGVPRAWVAKMRASMSRLTPLFSSNRMLRDYVEKLYVPAAGAYQKRTHNGLELCGKLAKWQNRLRRYWQDIHWGNIDLQQTGKTCQVTAQLYLGDIPVDTIAVQLYANGSVQQPADIIPMQCTTPIPGAVNGFHYQAHFETERCIYDFTARVIPYHPYAYIPNELNLINWQR